MSRISTATTTVLLRFLKPGQKVIELFPGDSIASEQSLKLIHKITGIRVVTIGMHSFGGISISVHTRFIRAKVPPYPRMWFKKFDVVFINEIYDLISAEHPHPHGPVKFKFPAKGLTFLNKKLKRGGLFILSDVHKEEADIMFRWLQKIGQYDYQYKGDCGIFTKLL